MRWLYVLCVFVTVWSAGQSMRRRPCVGHSGECATEGRFPGVRVKQTETIFGIRREYICGPGEVLNIPPGETFKCCWGGRYLRYVWRSEARVFKLQNDILTCEAKVECGPPPDSVENMTRTEVKRYMSYQTTPKDGGKYYDGDTVQYECNKGFESVASENSNTDDGSDETNSDVTITSSVRCDVSGQWVDQDTNREDINIGLCKDLLADDETAAEDDNDDNDDAQVPEGVPVRGAAVAKQDGPQLKNTVKPKTLKEVQMEYFENSNKLVQLQMAAFGKFTKLADVLISKFESK